MTTQFSQRVTYELVLLWSSSNSYFILSPQSISINNHCLSFGSFQAFSDIDSILPHYSPAFPVNFEQFAQAWCEETIRAYFNHLNIGSYINQIQYERVRYQPNGNNASVVGSSYCILSCSLLLNNQIDTDFDNLFANLISSLNTLLTPISQISLSLLGINNVFPTLVHNLEALNENNVPVSIAQILKDKQIDVDMSGTEVSLDDTNLVTQLQNIYTILASQNANQSAISSAITNKDNQSDIVQQLEDIFISESSNSDLRFSSMKYGFVGQHLQDNSLRSCSMPSLINKIANMFYSANSSITSSDPLENIRKFEAKIWSTLTNDVNVTHSLDLSSSNSKFNSISNIETKLEQNLPFTTIVENEIVETNVSQNCNYSSKIEQIPFSE